MRVVTFDIDWLKHHPLSFFANMVLLRNILKWEIEHAKYKNIKWEINMVNTGNDKRVRNVRGAYPHDKDDALELKAKMLDFEAKYKALKESIISKIEPVKGEIEEKVEEPIIEEIPLTEEELAEIEKAKEIKELKAKLSALEE